MSAFHILLLSRLATSRPLLSPSLREAETFAQSTAKQEADFRKQLTMEIEYNLLERTFGKCDFDRDLQNGFTTDPCMLHKSDLPPQR